MSQMKAALNDRYERALGSLVKTSQPFPHVKTRNRPNCLIPDERSFTHTSFVPKAFVDGDVHVHVHVVSMSL